MAEPRTFAVCQGCGAWKETGGNPLTLFADYDMRFFIEQHLARCPVTGRAEMMVAVHEDDPNYHPLPAEKRWRPESCPGYRPSQRPTSRRYKTEIPQRLVGIWTTLSFGAHSNECLVLFPDGTGVLEYYNVVFAGYRRFHWRLDGPEHLCFGDAKCAAVVEEVDGAADYFGTYRTYFELLSHTNSYGEERDKLCVYPDSIGGEPQELVRTSRSIENYEIPDQGEPDGLTPPPPSR